MQAIQDLLRTYEHKTKVLELHRKFGNTLAEAATLGQIESLQTQLVFAIVAQFEHAAVAELKAMGIPWTPELLRAAERAAEIDREEDEADTLRTLRREMGPLGGGK